MKKIAVFFLALLYVTATSGVMVNIHYCMGDVSSVKYGVEKDKACEKCGMQQKKGCCHTEHKLIKSDQAQLSVSGYPTIGAWVAEVTPEYALLRDFNHRNADHHACQYHSPPNPQKNSLYVVLRV